MSAEPWPRLDEAVLLRCVRCELEMAYRVGTFVLPPEVWSKSSSLGDAVLNHSCGFTNAVRCRRCLAAGPWNYPEATCQIIRDLLDRRLEGDEESQLVLGTVRAYDGMSYQYGGQVENHLKRMLLAYPRDVTLWTALGLFYFDQDDLDVAEQAFKTALELSPMAIEARYGLGSIHQLAGRYEAATECYRTILRQARYNKDAAAELRRLIVENAVEQILKMDADSGERRLLRDLDAVLPGEVPEEDLYLQDFDPAEPEAWKRLIDSILGIVDDASAPARPALSPSSEARFN